MRHAAPARRQVAACFAVLRDARQGIGYDFAADNQHALIAFDDIGDVTLRHDGAGIQAHQGFEYAADVGVFFGQTENAHAAHSVQRFDDDVAVFGQKGAHVCCAGSHDGRGNELREVQDGEFFVEVAHGLPAVEDFRASAFGQGKQLGGVEVLHVERRIGTHDDRAEFGQGRLNGAARLKPCVVVVVFRTEKFKRCRRRIHDAVLHRQFGRQGVKQAVPAPCGLAHHGVGGVFIGFETGQGVGDKQNVHSFAPRIIGRNDSKKSRRLLDWPLYV